MAKKQETSKKDKAMDKMHGEDTKMDKKSDKMPNFAKGKPAKKGKGC